MTRKRVGWPDLQIDFSRVNRIYERTGRLAIESVEPRTMITIPDTVEGFPNLPREFQKHGPIPRLPASRPSR